jgi:HAD superfamily hydrolase (TIGR01509 family)
MKHYILWDNDGVLVDTEYWYFKATQRALGELGVVLEKPAYLQRMVHGESSWELALSVGIDPIEVLAKKQQRNTYYQEYLVKEDIEIPGVQPVLEALSKTYKMAIVTTSKRVDFELIHNNRNIVQYMEFVLAREDYELSKPDPEPYLTGLRRLRTSAEKCLVVEDSQRGLQSAIAAGIDCAIVHNDFTASHNFSGARYILDSIADLPAVLNVEKR